MRSYLLCVSLVLGCSVDTSRLASQTPDSSPANKDARDPSSSEFADTSPPLRYDTHPASVTPDSRAADVWIHGTGGHPSGSGGQQGGLAGAGGSTQTGGFAGAGGTITSDAGVPADVLTTAGLEAPAPSVDAGPYTNDAGWTPLLPDGGPRLCCIVVWNGQNTVVTAFPDARGLPQIWSQCTPVLTATCPSSM